LRRRANDFVRPALKC